MKGEMSTPSTRRPSSALILQASGLTTTSSLPSPGTCRSTAAFPKPTNFLLPC